MKAIIETGGKQYSVEEGTEIFVEKFAWQLENVEVFDEPIDAKGKLSLWEYEI